MKNITPKILKGFRDFLPNEARKRQYVIDILKKVFESYGFEPLETPSLEYEKILLGKYGEEGDKLMYRFTDRGKRKVALRYDQTVPLARVVAQYGNELTMPFKRYQIQPVWRADNTQKGRFREFLQCDADIVGSDSPLADGETIMVVAKSLGKLGFSAKGGSASGRKNFKILINDRNIFSQLVTQGVCKEKDLPVVIRAIDKFKKIGQEGVKKELLSKGMTQKDTTTTLQCVVVMQETERIKQVFSLLRQFGLKQNKNFTFSPTLARGLEYYTSMIFEVEIEGYSGGSVCGGGRYDNLIGLFARSASSGQAGKQIPAVGFAFGFDRLIEAMTELKLFPTDLQTTKVLVTIFSPELKEKSLAYSMLLRSSGVQTEIYLDENASLEKQLKYADKKGIPYVVIIGPDEATKNLVTLRNMKTRKQEVLIQKDLVSKLV